MTVRMISKINRAPTVASFGLRKISFIFTNSTAGDADMSCLAPQSTHIIISNNCTCPVGKYPNPSNPSSCLACDVSCNTCFGGQSSQCYSCDLGYSYVNGRCIGCDSSCQDCFGPASNQCLRCVSGNWHKWDNTCPTSCSSPSYAQKTVGSIKVCMVPCTSGQFYLWNGTCSASCASPFIQRSNNYGQFCDLPCGNTEFYDWNNVCQASCSSPLVQKNQSGFLTCSRPCASGQYFYWNSSCLSTCDSPFIQTDQSGFLKCNLPCASGQYYYWNSSCISTCSSPLIQANQSGFSTCSRPCASTQYFYWNSSCLSTCSSPLIQANQSGFSTCSRPCANTEYFYWNSSCLPTCDSPFIQTNQSGFSTCSHPCANTEYFYWNTSCLSTCDSPFIQTNQSGFLTCSRPCASTQYFYWNSSCLSTCSSPLIQANQSGYSTCSQPCASGEYFYWNSSCLSTCNSPFIQTNQSGFLTCNLSCADGQYLYWNSSCISVCNSPFVQTNQSGFPTCSRPCASTQYFYWNSSCLPTCSSPLIQANQSGFSTCSHPCTSTEYFYWNNSCLSTCNSPFIQTNQSGFLTCNLPCANGQYLYWNSSCLPTCNSPFIQTNQSGSLTCSQPCASGQYFYWNSSCLSTCNSPFIQANQSGFLTCDLPCANGQYLYWNSSCSSTCNSPLIQINLLEILTCNLPCPASTYLYPNDTCLQNCTTPYIITNRGAFNSCDEFETMVSSLETNTRDLRYIPTIIATNNIVMTGSIAMVSVLGIQNPASSTLAGFIKMLPYIKYMKINYPPRLQYLLDNLGSSIISFQFGLAIPSNLQSQFAQYPLPDNFAKYELPSSFLVNYFQTLTSLLMIVCVVIVLSILCYLIKKKYTNMYDLLQRLMLIFKWNFLLMIFTTNLDGVALPTSLELRTLNLHSASNIISFLCCLSINVAAFGIFCLIIYIIRDIRRSKRLIHSEGRPPAKNPEDKWKYYQLFYKGSKSDLIIRHIFILPYLIRLYLFYCVIAYLFEYPLTQAILILLLNLILLGYMLGAKPFTSQFVMVQHCSDEITMTVVNICVLILAILDAKGLDLKEVRQNLGDLIIYANLWFSFTANIFLIGYLALGFKSAYQNTKYHGSKGIISWLTVFLSPFEAGGMDVDVMSEQEGPRSSDEKEEKVAVFRKPKLSVVSSYFSKSSLVGQPMFNSGELNRSSIRIHNMEKSPSNLLGETIPEVPSQIQDSLKNQSSINILIPSPSHSSTSLAYSPFSFASEQINRAKRSELIRSSFRGNAMFVNKLKRGSVANFSRRFGTPVKSTARFSEKIEIDDISAQQ